MHSLPLPTLILLHGFLAYVLLVSPWRSRRNVQKAEREIEAGSTTARLALYREILLSQVLVLAFLLGLVAWGRVPSAAVGLGAPASWPLAAAATGVAATLLVWSGFRMRRQSGRIRDRLGKRSRAMIPSTRRERSYFAAVSLGSGPTEELLCRGFMFYCVRLWLPALDVVSVLVISSAIFGFAHLYQGWRGVLSTGIGGAILGAAFVATGNLLLPVVIHSLGNLRVAFLRPETGACPPPTPLLLERPPGPAQTQPTAHRS